MSNDFCEGEHWFAYGGARYLTQAGRELRDALGLPDTATADDVESVLQAREEGRAAGFELGVQQERRRIAAILQAREAVGRFDLARELALQTNATPEGARAVLATTPRQSQPRARDPDVLRAQDAPGGFVGMVIDDRFNRR